MPVLPGTTLDMKAQVSSPGNKDVTSAIPPKRTLHDYAKHKHL